LFHKTSVIAVGLFPVALMIPASMSAVAMPVDVALAILLPLHGHIGMNWVLTDYVPGSPTSPLRVALLAASALTTLGLLKLSVTGDGLIGSLKSTWAGAKKEETK
jgi:succinate dehydrogenase (ubiquinone) membrane anchor subunit